MKWISDKTCLRCRCNLWRDDPYLHQCLWNSSHSSKTLSCSPQPWPALVWGRTCGTAGTTSPWSESIIFIRNICCWLLLVWCFYYLWCFYCDASIVVMFLSLWCFYCDVSIVWDASTVVMLLLWCCYCLWCFYCDVSIVVMHLLLWCFFCDVSIVVMLLLWCFYCCDASIVVMLLLL